MIKGLLAAICLLCAFPVAAATTHIRFTGQVTDESVAAAVAALKEAAKESPRFILFEINSRGGMVDAGFELSKALEDSPVPVVCVVDGYAYSMAFYILQSCKLRLMTNRSLLLVHKPSSMIVGSGNDNYFNGIAYELTKLGLAMLQHYANHLKLSAKEIRAKIAHGNWIMDYTEALKVGAVDGVVRSVNDLKLP